MSVPPFLFITVKSTALTTELNVMSLPFMTIFFKKPKTALSNVSAVPASNAVSSFTLTAPVYVCVGAVIVAAVLTVVA